MRFVFSIQVKKIFFNKRTQSPTTVCVANAQVSITNGFYLTDEIIL